MKNVPLRFELDGVLVPVRGKSRCVELLQLQPAVVPQCDEFSRRHSKEVAFRSGDGSAAVASLP